MRLRPPPSRWRHLPSGCGASYGPCSARGRWGAGLGGEIEIRPGDTPIGAVYVFRAKSALFVENRAGKLPGLEFTADAPANVMLRWNAKEIRVISSADAALKLDLSVFAPTTKAAGAKVPGKLGGLRRDGGRLEFQALEGEEVVIGAGR